MNLTWSPSLSLFSPGSHRRPFHVLDQPHSSPACSFQPGGSFPCCCSLGISPPPFPPSRIDGCLFFLFSWCLCQPFMGPYLFQLKALSTLHTPCRWSSSFIFVREILLTHLFILLPLATHPTLIWDPWGQRSRYLFSRIIPFPEPRQCLAHVRGFINIFGINKSFKNFQGKK